MVFCELAISSNELYSPETRSIVTNETAQTQQTGKTF
jgi:hypothetical protein